MKRWLLFLFLASNAHAITIGAGPAIGTDKRGVTWYQEFQDWTSNDVRALGRNDDEYKGNNVPGQSMNDAYASSRDLVALYSHDGGADGNYYFRVDLFDLAYQAEQGNLDVYLAIAMQLGDANGQNFFPDNTKTQTDTSWRICAAIYDTNNGQVYDKNFTALGTNNFVSSQGGGISYWRADLDSMEFGIKRQVLLNAGWDGVSPLYFQVITVHDGTQTGGPGELPNRSDVIDYIVCPGCGGLNPNLGGGFGRLSGSISSTATVNRAKYAAIAHANQSLGTRSQTQGHILVKRPDLNLYPGFIRAIDSAEMLHAPLNMHISGTLLSSFLWARENPNDPGYTYPERDGPAFLQRLKSFIQGGTGSLIGGVYAEHIMPYFEGQVNQASIRAFNDLAQSIFGLTTNDMKVMHVPERVIHSNTGWAHANPNEPLKGKPFDDIKAGGYAATYLDEISHLHWWFYQDETNFFNNSCGCSKWAGFGGCEDRPYHHKLHKINGVLTFMINDREDQSKFGNDDGGMLKDTRYTLLDKALSPDYAQLTLVFDDWEAYAGNCFTCAQPVNNADQWHNTIRWAANHQWIQIVNLKDVVTWAQSDTNWIYEDHGNVDGKTSQTYEWLKHASEHSYDNWYYGSGLEESFFNRVPPTAPSGFTIAGTKKYGDMNTTNTLFRDSWDKVTGMPAGNMKSLAEWTYSAMIYETAWHDELPPAWWVGGGWDNSYKSRNYQVTFDRHDACTDAWSDDSYDVTSGWALRLHGHARKVGILADAGAWAQQIRNNQRGPATESWYGDLDDDKWDEYVLKNNRVYLCFKRWGARLLYAFVYDPVSQDAIQVVGAPVANPSEEHDGEGADNNRCSAFKDRYASTPNDNRYVDMDYAAPTLPAQGADYWEFVSNDGKIRKRVTLPNGRDAVRANYTLGNGVGSLYIRHGLGPNQWDLLHNGDSNLVVQTDSFYYGLTNKLGGAVYTVRGTNNLLNIVSLSNAGYQNRELPMVEQVEVYNSATNFATWLAFSPTSAQDIDGDGLPNAFEQSLGLNYELTDTDSNGVSDADEDMDADGMSNLQEYIAGTAANNAASVFKIHSVAPQAGGGFVVTWASVAGKQYQVQSTDNLGTAFAPLSGVISASGTVTSYADGTAVGRRFYKVKVVVP